MKSQKPTIKQKKRRVYIMTESQIKRLFEQIIMENKMKAR